MTYKEAHDCGCFTGNTPLGFALQTHPEVAVLLIIKGALFTAVLLHPSFLH